MTVGEVSDLGVKFSKRRDGKDLFPGGTTTLNRRQVISSKLIVGFPEFEDKVSKNQPDRSTAVNRGLKSVEPLAPSGLTIGVFVVRGGARPSTEW